MAAIRQGAKEGFAVLGKVNSKSNHLVTNRAIVRAMSVRSLRVTEFEKNRRQTVAARLQGKVAILMGAASVIDEAVAGDIWRKAGAENCSTSSTG